MQTQTLAIDFGTSNSAAAVPFAHGIYRIPVERGAETLPTAVFFPADEGPMRIGAAASDALIAGEDGRYMRALKSVLGLPLLHEKRLIGGRRRTLAGIVTDFLTALRQRSEAATGLSFRRALSGRPVHFHSADPDKDARAEADLRACYLAAGFDEVAFLAEPEAAALACQGLGTAEGIGLIVDIGGGTSDFSVFRSGAAGPEILANHGIRLGGTDFDQAVSLTHAMPQLGLGGHLRRQMGAGLLPVPRAPYVDLATWAKIPFLYTPETRRMVADMVRLAVDRQKMARLGTVLEMELGHELAFAVERGKIAANGGEGPGRIAMGFIEPGLSETVSPEGLDAALAENRALLRGAAAETLALAGVAPGAVGRVILVGGSSLMGFVADEARALCPGAGILRSEAFTAVVDGLALATLR
ncbi:Hsp70 family protein [Antarcticimicrobium luteum]|uniref:Hsp70 family protein n=1 Tax=Antarcticimicrobium luteum TaxID=2547397 RepID=A0A4R5UQ94_9RHOB|nr:Hsp70 family protein [Antarcticimicrobium luteum]TDK41085.1 Hsp70 family protein [Antarcticimicrobium luteum]